MDAPCGQGSVEGGSEPFSEVLTQAYRRIRRACLLAGLARADADDLAQDLLLWLVETGRLDAASILPWVGAAAQNFIKRYWRERWVRRTRESSAALELERTERRQTGTGVDLKVSLDRLERRLPAVEAELLRLVRGGASFAEATRVLHIPRGSLTFLRNRLIQHLALGFGVLSPKLAASPPTNRGAA